MNSHDVLTIMLILIIVVIQISVFLSIFRRIKLFREIFPDARFFKTVKVYVPIERIADITPEEILGNLSRYSGDTDEEQYHAIQIVEEAGQEYDDHLPDDDLVQQESEWDEDDASEVWVRKENQELKIPNHLVPYYAERGWHNIDGVDGNEQD